MFIVTNTQQEAWQINNTITATMFVVAVGDGATVDAQGIVGKTNDVNNYLAARTSNYATPRKTVDDSWAIPQPEFDVDLSSHNYEIVESVEFPEMGL